MSVLCVFTAVAINKPFNRGISGKLSWNIRQA